MATTNQPVVNPLTTYSSNIPAVYINQPPITSGNENGLVVQDGINQPWFIYFDATSGTLQSRPLHTYGQWVYDPTGAEDDREYVPVGTLMCYNDGILYVLALDGNTIYRSVTGRPLDFVVNVDSNGDAGGDATTTSITVGAGTISAMRPLSTTVGSSAIIVTSETGAAYSNAANRTPNAPTVFGEPTFILQYLFDANIINNQSWVDILGDFAFIGLTGVRDFNYVQQQQNEGRNSVLSQTVMPLFGFPPNLIVQQDLNTSAIIFDNYAIFSMNTTPYGQVMLVYDTVLSVWVSVDTQTGGVGVKQFAKHEINEAKLYGITTDNRLLQFYASNTYATSTARIASFCSQKPMTEIKPNNLRAILNNMTQTSLVTASCFVDNRISDQPITKQINYLPPNPVYTGTPTFSDVNSMCINLFWTFPNSRQGWKVFYVLSWTGGGSITNVSSLCDEKTPQNPLETQATVTQ